MNILTILVIPIVYVISKIFLFIIVKKYGKFSFDGFDAFGFSYNNKKDTFDTSKNAWQKNFGYTYLYDLCAPLVGMVIDTESIKFMYNNKHYLISFWKGQYGISTGGEIGIYYTDDLSVDKYTLYLPVEDDNMLDMSFTLYHKGKYITSISEKHWWLATFKLGMFSKPKHLSMTIKIIFKNEDMLNCFMNSFKKLHYKKKDFKVEDKTFCLNYKHPKTKKVWTRIFLIDAINNYYNQKKVKLYNAYTEGIIDNNQDNNLIVLNDYIPDILKNNTKEIGYYNE